MKFYFFLFIFVCSISLAGKEVRLNNLVSRLFSVQERVLTDKEGAKFSFELKKDAWIWLRLEKASASLDSGISIRLDQATEDLPMHAFEDGLEGKFYLAAGKHFVYLRPAGSFHLKHFICHRIPEIILSDIYCNIDSVKKNNHYHSWSFLKHTLLPNATTLVFDTYGRNTLGKPQPNMHDTEQKEWLAHGGKIFHWIPIFRTRNRFALARAWSNILSNPLGSGLIHDELNVVDAPDLPEWSRGLRLLNPQKKFRRIMPNGTLDQRRIVYYYEHTNNYYGKKTAAVIQKNGGPGNSPCVKLVAGKRADSGFFQKNLILDQDRQYTLSAKIRTKDLKNSSPVLSIKNTKGIISPDAGSTDWKTYQVSFQAPGTGKYELRFLLPNSGVARVTDLMLVPGKEAEKYAHTTASGAGVNSQNRILNGNFSEGSAGWESWETDTLKWNQFMQTVKDCHALLVYEDYLADDPPEILAGYIKDRTKIFAARRKAVPGIENNIAYTFGFAQRSRWSRDLSPLYDYKASLDRQLLSCAVSPEYDQMAGVGFWFLNLADEELIRYGSKLLRHYAILGKTALYYRKPYELTHLKNPSFEAGLKDWTVKAAAENSISVVKHGSIPSQIPASGALSGSHLLQTVSVKGKANIISQKVKNLIPGEYYALSFFTMNPTFDSSEIFGYAKIDNVVPIHEKDYKKNYYWEKMPWSKACGFSVQLYVFRALGTEALLTLSDQNFDKKSSSLPDGVVIDWDSVQIQPYFMK